MLKILYEDDNLIIIDKPVGILSQGDLNTSSCEDLVAEHLGYRVHILHRLDRGVSGALAFAKNKKSAAELAKMISESQQFMKEYWFVVGSRPELDSGRLEDFLFKDSRTNKVFSVKSRRKGAKRAVLDYRVIAERDGRYLISAVLLTGRTHQVRVQFASRKMPLLGDGKYGSREKCDIALYCRRISLEYPSGNKIEAVATNSSYPFNLFS